MKKKAWDITVKDNPNRVVMGENDEFYTTDTEAYLVFKLDDKNFNPATAVLTLENRNDGSLKNETVDVVDGLIEWEMPQRYIEHFGNWQGQLVYEDTKDGQPELYTSAPFSFVVNAHIGDKKQPSLVEIENWEKFIRDGTELIETWEDMEDLRQANEAQRQANYQELLDTGVLQTNINTKLEQLEEEYAPKLTEVTAQLAQKATKGEVNINHFDEPTRQAFLEAQGIDVNYILGSENVKNENLADDEVTNSKLKSLDLVYESPFTTSGAMNGYKLIHSQTGFVTEVDPAYIISDVIHFTSLEHIVISVFSRLEIYDASGALLTSRRDIEGGDLFNQTIGLPEGSSYMRLSIKKRHLDDCYVIQSDKYLIEKPQYNFNNLLLNEKQISLATKEINENMVDISTLEEYNEISDSTVNLFDKSKMVDGHWRLESGNITFRTNLQSTGLIPVKPNHNYIATGITHNNTQGLHAAFFNHKKEPTKGFRINVGESSPKSFETDVNTFFISIQLDTNMGNYREYPLGWHPNNFLVCEGTEIPAEYIEFKQKQYKLDGLVTDQIDTEQDGVKIFESGKDFNSNVFRIPFICTTKHGTIIAGSDVRYRSHSDFVNIDVAIARSVDYGKTWDNKQVILKNDAIDNNSRVMDGTILYDSVNDKIFVFGVKLETSDVWYQKTDRSNWDMVYTVSEDDGITWSEPISVADAIEPFTDRVVFLGGVGSGITMEDGTLVLPIQVNDNNQVMHSAILYSTDAGVSWTMSESLLPANSSECTVVEYPRNTLIVNARSSVRQVYQTTDMGANWTETPMNHMSVASQCQGHMCKVRIDSDKESILFTHPNNDGTDPDIPGQDRSNLTLFTLQNDKKFLPIYSIYRPNSRGYSCIAYNERDNRLYIVNEVDFNLNFRDISFMLPTVQLYKNLEEQLTS